MENASDFTFSQAGLSLEKTVESPKVMPDVGSMIISEKSPNDAYTMMAETLQASESSSVGESTKKVGTDNSQLKKVLGIQSRVKDGDSENALQKQNMLAKKGISRAKVPFEKGYSQMSWLRLTQTQADLSGLGGEPPRRLITFDEVNKHRKEGSVWTVLKGRVYNISPYMKFHPGGVDMLMKAAGRDCTSLFSILDNFAVLNVSELEMQLMLQNMACHNRGLSTKFMLQNELTSIQQTRQQLDQLFDSL